MYRYLFAALVAWVGFAPGAAEASVFGNLLSFDGSEDIVSDDSVGIFVDLGVDPNTLEVGDLIQGMINFDPIDGNGVPAGSSVIGAYSFEVASILAPGDAGFLGIGIGTAQQISFSAATGANSVESVLSTAGVNLNGLDFTGAGIAILESSSADVAGNASFAGPPFGFTAGSGILPSDFDAVLTASVIEHLVVSNVDITNVAAPLPSGIGVNISFTGTYDVVDHAFGSDVIFLDVINANTGTVGDIKIDAGGITAADGTTGPNGFAFNDDGDYVINAVPEPTTFLVWTGLSALVAGVGSTRRKMA